MSAHLASTWLGEEQQLKPRSARRCLFGKTDRKTLDVALTNQEEALEKLEAERFCKKWGFDPVEGFPVDNGMFICTPVDLRKEQVPEFYTKGYVTRKSKPVCRARESWRGPYNAFVFSDAQQDHSRRMRSVKRHLEFDDDQENNHVPENLHLIGLRVPSPEPDCDGNSHHATSLPLTVPTRPSCPSVTSLCSKEDSSTSLSTLQRSVSTVVISRDRLSVAPSSPSRKRLRLSHSSLDLATPRSITAQNTTPRQTLMKDFYPTQKLKRSSFHLDV